MKVLKVKEIINRLEQEGWVLYRHSGTSHRQYKHPEIKGKVTVNGKLSADISKTLLKNIERQSGIIF